MLLEQSINDASKKAYRPPLSVIVAIFFLFLVLVAIEEVSVRVRVISYPLVLFW